MKHTYRDTCPHVFILHVFRGWHGIRSRRLWRWVKAGLAAEVAGIATETVDVGPSGVVRHPPCLWVERVLLVYVIVLFVPGRKLYTRHRQRRTQRVHALTLCRSARRAVRNGIRGSLGADLLPNCVHIWKVAHSTPERAQAASRENKER